MAILMRVGLATHRAAEQSAALDTAPEADWNLLRYDGRLWMVTPEAVIDLGQEDEAMHGLQSFLRKDAEERRPKAVAA